MVWGEHHHVHKACCNSCVQQCLLRREGLPPPPRPQCTKQPPFQSLTVQVCNVATGQVAPSMTMCGCRLQQHRHHHPGSWPLCMHAAQLLSAAKPAWCG